MKKNKVILRVYKIGNEASRTLLSSVLKREIEGIWHTSIEVFGKEIFFQNEIVKAVPGSTIHGIPHRTHDLGETIVTEEDLNFYLECLDEKFGVGSYHLIENNCNNFTDTLSLFLVDQHIPDYIMEVQRLVSQHEQLAILVNLMTNPGP